MSFFTIIAYAIIYSSSAGAYTTTNKYAEFPKFIHDWSQSAYNPTPTVSQHVMFFLLLIFCDLWMGDYNVTEII